MKKYFFIFFVITTVIILSVTILLKAGIKISGKVIDAESGKPIKNAVVRIDWGYYISFGFTTGDGIELYYDITDSDGIFYLPYYLLYYDYSLTAYKHGYSLWRESTFFPEFSEKSDFKLKSGSVIELKPLRNNLSEEYAALVYGTNGLLICNLNRKYNKYKINQCREMIK